MEKGDPGQRAPMLIKQMDETNAKMNKQKQAHLDSSAAAMREIAKLEAQESFLLKRYDPLVATLGQRRKFRGHTKNVLRESHDTLARNINMARLEKRHASNEAMAHTSMAARHELDACRGFTCDVGTTANRFGKVFELHEHQRRGKKPGSRVPPDHGESSRMRATARKASRSGSAASATLRSTGGTTGRQRQAR